MRGRRGRRVILIGGLIAVGVMILASGIGTVRIPPGTVVRILMARLPGVTLPVSWPAAYAAIIWSIRIPRVVLALLAGMALSVAGGAYQGLFKNPLADPYVLGVSGGAALGASVAIAFLSWLQLSFLGTIPIFSFAGGIAAVWLVYRLAAVGDRVPVVGLLLAGVTVGSFSLSVVSAILFFTSPNARDAIIFWMMGGLGGASWEKVGWLLLYVAVGMTTLLFHGRELNAMLLGEETAHHLGVHVERLKRTVLVAGALLTAAAVSFCGAIGFVGLVVPHLVRLLVGPDHRALLPASAVLGGLVLVIADTAARTVLGSTEIPVGLVMAVLGGPFFLWLLRRKLRPLDS